MPGAWQLNDGNADRVFVGNNGTAFETENLALQRNQAKQQQAALDQQGQQANLDRILKSGQGDQDRAVQLQLGMAPINLKRDVFNQVSPLLTGLLGSGGPGSVERVGGQSDAAPAISRGPVWSDQQVTEQANAGKAANAAAGDTQNRSTATRMAGQGFGTRSPLLAALTGATNTQTAANNADVDRTTRWDAAQGNADQTYRTDQLATQQWDQAQQQDIARRQMQNTYTSNLASVLAGLV